MEKNKESHLIEELREKLPWKQFLEVMENHGFVKVNSIKLNNATGIPEKKENLQSGFKMLIDNKIHSNSIRDPSLLSLNPYIIFRPLTELQLRYIILASQNFKIPITFASGKTGLSGGYSNYGIIVDLANLHSFDSPINLDIIKEEINVEQSVLISDLIKLVPFRTNGKYIFPVQPASAYKLPVRVGGIISSNASGITSGKLGAVEDWLVKIRIMKVNGEIVEIEKGNPLFKRVVGGNGYFGVILNGLFKLYKPSSNLKRSILYGYDIDLAFDGLQSVLEAKIFPLISEFVVSLEYLPGKFKELSVNLNNSIPLKWAVIIKGSSEDVNNFVEKMLLTTKCNCEPLNEVEFQEYLQERSSFGILSQSTNTSEKFIAFPGFEDILSEPKFLPNIINEINKIFTKHGFHPVIFEYGHINFRKGQGLLLHIRLPVPIDYFYKEKRHKLTLICETVYDVINSLKENFSVKHKAEHSPGPFQIWLDPKFRKLIRKEIVGGTAFINPHLSIFDELLCRKFTNELKDDNQSIYFEESLSDRFKRELFVSAMKLYLS